jgi:hypothetical protein
VPEEKAMSQFRFYANFAVDGTCLYSEVFAGLDEGFQDLNRWLCQTKRPGSKKVALLDSQITFGWERVSQGEKEGK